MSFRNFKEKCPKYVYMYIPKIEYVESNVVNGRFHIQVPANFNDIFDSAYSLNENDFKNIAYTNAPIEQFVYFTHVDYKKQVKEILYSNMNTSKRFDEALEILYKSNIDKKVLDEAKHLVLKYSSNMQAFNNKIACFTEVNDSILMWAHYANNMKGMCLRFDTEKDPILFKNLHKVIYSKFRGDNFGFNFYFIKSLDWSYEQEWRIVVDQEDDFIYTKAIDAIIMGSRINIQDFMKCQVLATKYNLEIYKAEPDRNEFKINLRKYEEQIEE